VRGFAAKFCTDEGIFDLVGNNIPVFFIHVPDLIHSVKMEADRGYPQDATVHDTFWDFISLLPESMNMVLWIMSDRTIPRSPRMRAPIGKLLGHSQPATTARGRRHWFGDLGRHGPRKIGRNRPQSEPFKTFLSSAQQSAVGSLRARRAASHERTQP
jgi:catalase